MEDEPEHDTFGRGGFGGRSDGGGGGGSSSSSSGFLSRSMDDEFPGGEALPGANQETIGEIHSQLVHVDEAAKADIARDYKVCAHEKRRICIIPGEPGEPPRRTDVEIGN